MYNIQTRNDDDFYAAKEHNTFQIPLNPYMKWITADMGKIHSLNDSRSPNIAFKDRRGRTSALKE